MKVVVAIDDSPYSATVINEVCRRKWPHDVQFKILTVVEPITADCSCEPDEVANICTSHQRQYEHAQQWCQKARERLLEHFDDALVHFEVRRGRAQAQIVAAAVDWDADRILIGARGRSVCPHFATGSVSRDVARHAHCTVEIIQDKQRQPALQAV